MKFFTKKIKACPPSRIGSRRGFTLVELMVVIAIIGILTAVILPALTTARKKGRVAQRVTDMKQVQAALALYYAANHNYPSSGGSSNWRGTCSTGGSLAANNVIPGLAPLYIPNIPTDPQTTDPDECYLYTSDGTDYAFLDFNIPEMYNSAGAPNYTSYPELVDPFRGSGTQGAWKVYSAGAVNW